MPSITDILENELFSDARIVAGSKGLDRNIAWVHTVGVPDAAQWLNGGELILTTIINMPESHQKREDYLHALIDKEVVGLVVTTGNMLDHIPDYLCMIADQHDFPLIEIPYQARFVDIARMVNEQITQANMAMVTRALHIQKTLTQLVLEGGGIAQLAETLVDLVNQSISIENKHFEVLAAVNIAAVDEARHYTQQYGHTNPHLVEALEVEILPKIRQTLHPVFIPQMPHVGLGMERILAPIVVHGEIYGFMWIIADGRPLSDLDHMAIESGATIAALMMLYQESIQNVEASVRGNLLTRLVQGKINGSAVLTDQALRYGIDLRRPYRVLLIDSPDTQVQHIFELSRRINRMVDQKAAIAGQFAGQVLMLVQEDESTRKNEAPETLARAVCEMASARVAISGLHHSADAVAQAYTQCQAVLVINQRVKASQPIVYFDDLGYLYTLYHAGPDALAGNPYISGLEALHTEAQIDLFHTLEIYLDAGGNGVQAAENLHIHRSTLNYRLQRISEICKVDLSDPAIRMNLQIALKLLLLFGH